MISISQIHRADWQDFKAIRLEALKEDPQAFGSSLEKELQYSDRKWQERVDDSTVIIFQAKNDVTPIGMIGIHIKKDQQVVQLWGMFVSKNFRGKDVGKDLLHKALEKSAELFGIKKILLDVNPLQISAIRLYTSLGFVKSGTRLHLMGDGKDTELLSMEIQLS